LLKGNSPTVHDAENKAEISEAKEAKEKEKQWLPAKGP